MIDRPIYVDRIMKYLDTPFIKVLTGVRRCGKSTIMKLLMEKLIDKGIPAGRILHYQFDSLEHEEIKNAKALFSELKQRLSPERIYLFLDEIQEVSGWEKVVNSLMSDYNVDIYVTGSNSRMMSSEISTHLTGRYISFKIFPLSFAEYLTFHRTFSIPEDPRLELSNYIKLGGFPAVNLRTYSPDEAYNIVRDIYQSTIYTDIVRRSQIRKVDQLERVVRFVFDNVGRTFSSLSLAKFMKSERRTIDVETVYSYLSKLESAFILHRCPRYDIQGKELLKTQEKFYLADSSLRYSVLGYTQDSVAAMLENLVYLELLRRGYDVYVGKLESAEVDFVAIRQENKLYIQVAQQIASPETEEREYGRLLAIQDNYPKYVLCADAFAGGNYQGIKTVHIADFLLSDEY